MKTTRQNLPGFSLVELVIVIAIFGVLVAAMFGIQGMAVRSQARGLGETAVHNSATMIGHAVRRALATATHMEPYPPDQTKLTTWNNVNPLDLSGLPMVPGVKEFSHFCLRKANPNDSEGTDVYLYQGVGTPPLILAPGFTCGNNLPVGSAVISPQLVAGGVPDLKFTLNFERSSTASNLIFVDYTVKLLAAPLRNEFKVGHKTQISIRSAQGMGI
jgi:prepilin-type N-terminal cleavage/methylation domain-containing protein